ncbi:MAG: 4Fe-4S dicluster domain-containing protein [bacterium]|nr:hypothetical protein [Deltaproteobacteria bacterium]MCP4906595.1 4Fe-4S dicluster domain-containing protein [bacterium]
MPARVVVVKRTRSRSFALLRAAPAWVSSVWAALRGPGLVSARAVDRDFPSDSGIPELRFLSDGAHRCTGCDLCTRICPSRALHLDASPGEGCVEVARFELALGDCIGCRRCAENCPEEALEMRETPPAVIARSTGIPESIDLLEPRGTGR